MVKYPKAGFQAGYIQMTIKQNAFKLPNEKTVCNMKRKALKTDDGWPDCPYCEAPFYYLDGEMDHIQARGMGGTNSKYNLVLVCKACNANKKNSPLFAWLKMRGISPEGVYHRLRALRKRLPADFLKSLGFDG